MAGLPPLPPGYALDGSAKRKRDPDLIKPLLDAGAEPTNGYRTPADIERLRRAGYTPAKDSDHLRGDAVDLVPGKSGLTLSQLAERTQQRIGSSGKASVHNGNHVHVSVPGWGMAPGTPDTPNSGLPPLPAGFTLTQRGSLQGSGGKQPRNRASAAPQQPLALSGKVQDGDTVGLADGRNGRLLGVDAYELGQQGRRPTGALVPLGVEARNALAGRVDGSTIVQPTGEQTYGRPVVALGNNGSDPAVDLLRGGNALAAPNYLEGDPRLTPYLEAERLARQNRLGGHGTNAEKPEQYRRRDGPWQGAEPGAYGNGTAVFGDEATPFQGLRPEIEAAYLAVANDPKATAADFMAFGKANGFQPDPADVERFLKSRDKGAPTEQRVRYKTPPRILTDPGDGKTGTVLRGVGDPVNMLDELGAVADTVGLTNGRENVFNSERRFGDVLWNNIDQNRAIIAHDEATHPYYRLGGQLASGVLLPIGGGARSVAGLAKLGAVEGGLAGFGAGEGNPLQRAPSAAAGAGLGAGLGAAFGTALGSLGKTAAKGWRWYKGRKVPAVEGEAAEDVARLGASDDPTPAALAQPADDVAPRTAAMTVGDAPSISGDLPPLPAGYAIEPPLGATRRMADRATPDEMAAAAERIEPGDVTPIPNNRVASAEEAAIANPGPFERVEAPDEFAELGVRRIGQGARVRGPLDMTQRLRTLGGVTDDGGNLAHLGIGNAPRRMPFGSNEQFLGKLVNDKGMHPDDAAHALWEEGYFPEFREAPTGADLIDRLHQETTGANRFFHPDDLEEVARFDAATAQRGTVERAEAEGAPLVEERGQTATLADVEANRPPVTAYEDLPTLGGKAGNIDLSKLESRGDIRRALQNTEDMFGGFDASRRGAISHEETAALADDLGMRADDLLKRRQGQALNAEEALAARRILAKSGDELVTIAQKAIGGSDSDLAAFRKAMLRHAAIQEQVTGATAEAGRALSQFKMAARSKDHNERIMRAVIEGAGGRDNLQETAARIVDLQKVPGALNKFAADAIKPTWKDKAIELWYNSLLSGPQTHAVNILSNSMTAVLQLPEHLAAAGLGKAREGASALMGRRAADRVLVSEIGPRTIGLLQGAREGLKAFRYTLKTGDVPDFVTKVETARQEAIGGVAGKVLRVPTRLLSAEDEFFKATARRMELAGLSVRKARGEGLHGQALKDRIAELNANPTDAMADRSMDYARYLTFQRPLGPAMRNVQMITQRHPWLKLFVPFIRTPTNILKFSLERSPAAALLGEVRTQIAAGGAERDLAFARMSLGTGLGMLVSQWVAAGHMTGGGPADENAKRLMRAGGWQPYSIKVGDRYYSYKRLDPLATTLGVVADMVDLQGVMTDRQQQEVVPLVIASVLQNLGNKTWLSGLSDIMEVVDEPQRNAHYFIERLAGSIAVPALSAQTARTIDPVARETSSEGYAAGILDAIRARVPGLSQDLLPKRGLWGEEMRNEGGVGPDIASPIWTGTDKRDPVVRELLKIGATIGPLSRVVGGERMGDADFNEYQAAAGKLTRALIEAEMRSPGWSALSAEEKGKAVDGAKKAARKQAREAVGSDAPAMPSRYIQPEPRRAARPARRSAATAAPPLPPGYAVVR